MAAYRRVYDSCHLQAHCQEPGSAPEPWGYLFSDREAMVQPGRSCDWASCPRTIKGLTALSGAPYIPTVTLAPSALYARAYSAYSTVMCHVVLYPR